jgi:hypothetical protein
MKRTCGTFLFLLMALLGLPTAVAAKDLTQPLTAEEVACNERQLEKLLQRMNAAKESHIPPQLPTILLVSYSNSTGFYDGLVATDQGFRLDIGGIPPVPAYEHYLAFNINPSIRTLLLNPGRPELSQVGLNREQSSSNLVTPGGYFDLTLTLNPTLGGGDPLVINNFEEPLPGEPYNGFLANSTKPGRGLAVDALLSPCHEKLTDFDRHVFSLLQRMIRSLDMGAYSAPDVEVSIFRGEEPQTYRINIYPIYENLEPRGRLAVALKLSWTPTGKLTSAILTALPGCVTEGQTGCTALDRVSTAAFLVPPVFGGTEYYPNDSAENGVFYIWYEGPSAPSTVNLEALLAHTTWNEPVW